MKVDAIKVQPDGSDKKEVTTKYNYSSDEMKQRM